MMPLTSYMLFLFMSVRSVLSGVGVSLGAEEKCLIRFMQESVQEKSLRWVSVQETPLSHSL